MGLTTGETISIVVGFVCLGFGVDQWANRPVWNALVSVWNALVSGAGSIAQWWRIRR